VGQKKEKFQSLRERYRYWEERPRFNLWKCRVNSGVSGQQLQVLVNEAIKQINSMSVNELRVDILPALKDGDSSSRLT